MLEIVFWVWYYVTQFITSWHSLPCSICRLNFTPIIYSDHWHFFDFPIIFLLQNLISYLVHIYHTNHFLNFSSCHQKKTYLLITCLSTFLSIRPACLPAIQIWHVIIIVTFQGRRQAKSAKYTGKLWWYPIVCTQFVCLHKEKISWRIDLFVLYYVWVQYSIP